MSSVNREYVRHAEQRDGDTAALDHSPRDYDVGGLPLDVRENVKFQGAHLVRWVNSTFTGTGCAFDTEVKKIFMDEHTGELDPLRWKEVHRALEAGAARVRQALSA